MQLIRGQKLKLKDILSSQEIFYIQVDISSTFDIDVALFGLDENSKLSNEDYMIFYNQPVSPCNSIKLVDNNTRKFLFSVNLSNLIKTIQKLVITLAIDTENQSAIMADIQSCKGSILNANKQPLADFVVDKAMFDKERAIMLLEIYLKSDFWRMSAVGQGFNGGLGALVEYFGGEVAKSTSTAKQVNNVNTVSSASSTVSKVNLTKINLQKTGDSHKVSLKKNDSFIVEAIWIDNGDGKDDNDDLDLRVGILIEDQRQMHYVYAPEHSGSLTEFPYIEHQGDVTEATVGQPGVEKVKINTDIARLIGSKVALVFSVYSAVSNGVVSIASLQPRMRMKYGNQEVECTFNAKVSKAAKSRFVYTYVIGTAIIGEESIEIQHSGITSKEMSEATPRLIWKNNGLEVKVDGPAVFKEK